MPFHHSKYDSLSADEHTAIMKSLAQKLKQIERFPSYICSELVSNRKYKKGEIQFVAWAETRGRLESIVTMSQRVGNDDMYIQYVCSAQPLSSAAGPKCRHVTTRLLAFIKNAAMRAGVSTIYLSSVPNASKFYHTIGMQPNNNYGLSFFHTNSNSDTLIAKAGKRPNTQANRARNKATANAFARLNRHKRFMRAVSAAGGLRGHHLEK